MAHFLTSPNIKSGKKRIFQNTFSVDVLFSSRKRRLRGNPFFEFDLFLLLLMTYLEPLLFAMWARAVDLCITMLDYGHLTNNTTSHILRL